MEAAGIHLHEHLAVTGGRAGLATKDLQSCGSCPLDGPIGTMHTGSAGGLERGERDSDSRVQSEGGDLRHVVPLSMGRRRERVWDSGRVRRAEGRRNERKA